MKKKIDSKKGLTLTIKIVTLASVIILIKSCIIIPNFDTEWTYPEIKGYLVDTLTNSPVDNVKVFDSVLGDTVLSDTNGFFNLKAKKEYIKYRWIVMDPPRPFIELSFKKNGYMTKEVTLRYIRIMYSRKHCDTIDLKLIKLKNNAP